MGTVHQEIVYEGQTFSNYKEFSNHFGLNYSKVIYYKNRGKSPKEILELCKFKVPIQDAKPVKEIKKTETEEVKRKKYKCEYDGVEYESIYEAANALNFNPSQAYDIVRKKKLSPSEAVAEMVSKQKKGQQVRKTVAKETIVDGVAYSSRQAALRAYNMKAITVYSRMEREGISFEEAVLRTVRAGIHCPPVLTMFPSLRLRKYDGGINHALLKNLTLSFDYYVRPWTCYRDIVSRKSVLCVDDDNYLFYNEGASGLEFITHLPFSVDSETLNLLNSSYVNTKLYTEKDGKLVLSGFQMAKEDGQNAKAMVHAYFAFNAIKELLIKEFSDEEVVVEVTEDGATKAENEAIPAGSQNTGADLV